MSCGSHQLSIFREYILQLNDFPTAVINAKTQKFDFILGFASEQGTGTGQFVPTWNDALSPEKVMDLKGKHPNVRVVISIGGVGSEFNPVVPQIEWIAIAVKSIKAIIQQYNYQIDGIDIHYDVIRTSEAVFSFCIGGVIQRLKDDPELLPIRLVVSIAPTQNVQDQYLQLYLNNRDNIDLVDYRFYNQNFASVPEFMTLYQVLIAAYNNDAGKFLAGIRINPQDLILFAGIIDLILNNRMPGVFVWNADESLEKILQDL